MEFEYSNKLSQKRINYLQGDRDFTSIISAISEEANIVGYEIEPSRCYKNAYRHNFIISVTPMTFDIFYNASFGYRGQYVLGTSVGNKANKQLINALSEVLVNYAHQNPSGIQISQNQSVKVSLMKDSAKVWIHQNSSTLDSNNYKKITDIDILNPTCWYKFAKKVEEDKKQRHVNYRRRFKAVLGIRAPVGTKIEIKGAFLDLNGKEILVKGKYSRAKQIRYYGLS